MTDPSWFDYAACTLIKGRSGGDEIFFGAQPQKAKAVCANCEVSIACLYFALMMEEPGQHRHGVFGMATGAEREAMNIGQAEASTLYEQEVQMWKAHKRRELGVSS